MSLPVQGWLDWRWLSPSRLQFYLALNLQCSFSPPRSWLQPKWPNRFFSFQKSGQVQRRPQRTVIDSLYTWPSWRILLSPPLASTFLHPPPSFVDSPPPTSSSIAPSSHLHYLC